MPPLLTALLPLFILIVAGYYMRKAEFPNEEFWPGAERFNYFILFPALLFSSLATAPLTDPALPRLLIAVLLCLFVCSVGLLIACRLYKWPGARFGALVQGALRFNTYLGLAAVGGLFGKEGLFIASVVLALYVPTVNIISVLAFSVGNHTSIKAVLLPIIKNPLIISCFAGVLFNLSGLELIWGMDRLLGLLASTSLPLGLLTVGAALQPKELHGEVRTLCSISVVRLLIVPAVAFTCAYLLGLPALDRSILVLFFALPTAPTAYVLTRQLGGDSHLMAGIITLQTLLSAASLTIVMSLVS